MNVNIFQIGGTNPEAFLGCAHDLATARSLVLLARLQGASGVSLHGTMPHLRDAVSGEFTLTEAERELDTSDHVIMAWEEIIEEARWEAQIS
jgi:hypothetical protein